MAPFTTHIFNPLAAFFPIPCPSRMSAGERKVQEFAKLEEEAVKSGDRNSAIHCLPDIRQ